MEAFIPERIYFKILLLIKKDRYAQALLRFRADDLRFIFPLRFHRRGSLIAANRGGNVTRSASTFPRCCTQFYLEIKMLPNCSTALQDVAAQFFDVSHEGVIKIMIDD